MKKLLNILFIAAMALVSGCHEIEQPADDPRGNFEALWSILDEHYCFFGYKDIDWDAVHEEFAPRISDEMNASELFDVCAEMLATLRDGHTNLISGFNTSYYRKWWSDYPQNYDARLVEEHYFNFNYRQTSGMMYGLLRENVGYVRYASFTVPIGEGNLDNVLAYLATASGLIIDIRDNGGGDLSNVETLVSRFLSERMLAGYITHKSGPGHDDFSEPYAFYYDPAPQGRIMWGKPVVVLVNRSTYSAANNFTAIMRCLPNMKIVGATTGGGSGMPFTSELPNGWGVRFSSAPLYDPEGRLTEFGIEPSEGCAVDLDPVAALEGRDTMLERAIEVACGQP